MTTLVVVRSDDPSSKLALETGLGLGGEVVAVAIGAGQDEPALRAAVAVGAHRAIHVTRPNGDPMSSAADAVALVPLVARLRPELVLLGARRGKLGTYGAGATLAELADLPHVGSVSSLHKASKDRLQAERRRESDVETVFCPLPAVVSIEWGVPLRYPTLPGRLRARRIDIEVDVVEAAAPGRVEVLRTTGPKPRHKLEQRTGPGFDHVLGLLLGGAGGGGGGRELSGDLEDVASQVVTACTRVLQGA